MLFSSDQIKPPYAVRQLTGLLVQNRLNDWNALRRAVAGGKESGDDLIHRYEHAWWNDLDGRSDIDSFRQNPHDIMKYWEKQKKNMPAPVLLPPLGLVQLQGLTDAELDRAYHLGCDSMQQLELEIEDNQKFLAEITVLLVQSQGLHRDLNKARDEALRERQGNVFQG